MTAKNQKYRDLQLRLADLMNEVHKICVANNIRYTMMGGTLIGALRHKGFIPWDDDIDIAMPYEDFVRFKEVMHSLTHDWVTFESAEYTESYSKLIANVYDSRTTMLETDRLPKIPKGIFIDVFPLSYVGNTKFQAICELRRYKFLRDIVTRKGMRLGRGLFALVEWVFILLGHFIETTTIINMVNKRYKKLNSKKTKWMSDLDGSLNGIVPSYLMDEFVLYDFEGYKFYGMKNADEYLRLVFGDYMKLPPEEKRIPHHIEYMDLNKSYLDKP